MKIGAICTPMLWEASAIPAKKTVIDFTGMNDTDLVAFFKINNKNVCGRFSFNQLQRDIKVPTKKIKWLRYFIHFTIPAFLISLKSTAQLLRPIAQIEITPTKQKKVVTETKKRDKFIIKGRVVDTTGMYLAGATVMIIANNIGVSTDTNGEFSIKCPDSSNIIAVSYIGYTSRLLASSNENHIIIALEKSQAL